MEYCDNCGAEIDLDEVRLYGRFFFCPACGAAGEISEDGSDIEEEEEQQNERGEKRKRDASDNEEEGNDKGGGDDDNLYDDEEEEEEDDSSDDDNRDTKRIRIGSGGGDDEEEEEDAPVSLHIGRQINHLRLENRRFRFGFWNLENLTGDPVRQGPRLLQESITSERNQVRIEFVAGAIVGLDLDCLGIMELGSDAESILRAMTEALSELDSQSTWEFTISELTGSVLAPPGILELQFHAFEGCAANIWALETILPYYSISDIRLGRRYGVRHIRAQQIVARRSDRRQFAELNDLLAQLKEQHQDMTDLNIAKQIHKLIERSLTESDAFDHEALATLFVSDNDREWQQLIMKLIRSERYYLVAIFIVLSGSTVMLEKNDVDIRTDGPGAALRHLGYNTGRYERYGFLFRTGLFASYLRSNLVMTDLLQEGRPTNSRAAVSFRMPLGRGLSVGAYMIHSMYSPIGEKLTAREGRMLRVETLVAQAQHACTLAPWDRPIFIFGDTNVDSKDIATTNDQMLECGYQRIGGTRRTTLRREGTLRSAFTRNGDFYSQPFDAVYQLTSRVDSYRTEVGYPGYDTPCIQGLFLQLLSRNDAVRNWYFLLLKNRYATIYYRIARLGNNLQGQILQGAIGGAAQVAKLNRDAPMSIAHTTRGGQDFLSQLFVTLREAMNMLEWPLEAEEEEGEGDRDDDEEDDDDDPKDDKAALVEHIRAFLRMAAETERAFLLFHRHFISDHRLVTMLMNYGDLVCTQRVQRTNNQQHWTSLAQAITNAGFTRQGAASGRGSSCFLYTLLQLDNADENEDHVVVALLRRELALRRTIPARGFVDAADQRLQSWVEHAYPTLTVQIWARNTITGVLEIRYTIGTGGTVVNMLLHGNHFTPLWP